METRTETLADRAYAVLEEMIVTLRLQPGSVVSEGQLSRAIHIGRTPLREALQRLAAEGLVATLPRRGLVVSEINIAHHLALLETRRVLDRLVVARAARRASADQRAALTSHAAAVEQAAAKQDLAEFMRLDREFDAIIETASRNAVAARVLAPLHAQCRRFWYMYHHNGDLVLSSALHVNVMRAVAAGDGGAAASASDGLIDYLEKFTRKTFDL